MHPHHRPLPLVVGLGALALALVGCPDAAKRPINASCSSDGQCASGHCIAELCLDPNRDDDGDGLTNAIEGALGTNPKSADTDGDGINDYDEVVNAGAPADSDGDGKPDAVESIVGDADGDCIKDQFDPDDAVPEVDPRVLAAKVCSLAGVCGAEGAVITASCADDGAGGRVHSCDYSQVTGYEAAETRCDGADNDCNGGTDEPFAAGGTVSFTDDDGVAGKVKGDVCGIGACAGGAVVCADATSLTCSTRGSGTDETCDGVDNDCNGGTDEPFRSGGAVVFDGGLYAADAGKVLGDSCGTGQCADGTVICDAQDASRLACATLHLATTEACDGADNDCDGVIDGRDDLLRCDPYYRDADLDGYGPSDDARCLCAAEGPYVTTAGGDCDDDSDKFHPEADPICGQDADCDGALLDLGEPCDDGGEDVFGDGCLACAVTEAELTSGEPRSRYAARVAAFGDGTFATCWQDGYGAARGAAPANGVQCAFVDATGAPFTTFGLDDNGSISRQGVDLIALEDGDAVLAWAEDDYDLNTHRVFAQRLLANGSPKGETFRLDDTDFDWIDAPRLAAGAGGAFLVAWRGQSYQTEGDAELRTRAFGPDDLPLGDSTVQAFTYNVHDFRVSGRGDGLYLASWIDLDRNVEIWVEQVVLQRINADGTDDGEPETFSGAVQQTGISAFAVATGGGGAFTVYYSVRIPGDLQLISIMAQEFGVDGTPDGDPVEILHDANALAYNFEVARLLDGTTLLAFGGYSQSEESPPVTAVIIAAGGVLPALSVPLQHTEYVFYSDIAAVAASPTGPFVVAWTGSKGLDNPVFYQRVAPDGTPLYR